MPDKNRVLRLLTTRYAGRELRYCGTVGSTNDLLKQRAETSANGAVLMADSQTAGRGRQGNRWIMQKGTGLAMSLLLKPVDLISGPSVTLILGLAAAKALRRLYGGGFMVKWPNDVVCGGKKIGGILCESLFRQSACFVVCGIGVNLKGDEAFFEAAGLPSASSVHAATGIDPVYEEAAAAILNDFEPLYEASKSDPRAVLKEYADHCITLGRQVRAVSRDGVVEGVGVGIGPGGGLVIETKDGRVTLNAGEVSVRGVMGYT